MIRKKWLVLSSILVLSCTMLVGCGDHNKTTDVSNTDVVNQTQPESKDKEQDKKGNTEVKTDIAEHITSSGKSIYIANLKIFDEFGTSNEGTVYIENEKTLVFVMTKATKTSTGAISGPKVSFTLNLDTNKITEKTVDSEIQLTDARIIEIGQYFAKFINELDTKK